MSVILSKNNIPFRSFEDELTDRLIKNQPDSFIYIVPTRRKVRELQREFLNKSTAATSSAFNLFTLETFATKLHQIYCKPKLILNPTNQVTLFAEVIRKIEKELKYFFPHGIRQTIPKGTIDKIIKVVNNLKESGVYPSALYEEIESAELGEKQKLKDMLLIYSEYESVLSENFIDAGGIFKEVNETLTNSPSQEKFRAYFPHVNSVFVAGFDEFSDPEITMLNAVSRFAGIGFIISFDYFLHNDELFGHLRENFEKFLALGFNPASKQTLKENSFGYHIAKNLFSSKQAVGQKLSCTNITILQANNREKEVEYISKLIKQMVHDNPSIDLSKICVAMYQPQIYTKLFHEILPRYGIPANITDRYPLDQSPLIVSIISLLNLWQNNFRQRDLMRAFSNPYINLNFNGSVIDINNLYSISTSLKISVDREYWKKRINERMKQIEIEQLDTADQFEIDVLQKEYRRMQKAHTDIVTIDSLLRRFSSDMTPSQFISKLKTLLDELSVSQNILGNLQNGVSETNVHRLEQIEKDARAYQTFFKVLGDLLDVFEIQNKSDVLHPLKFYIEQLKTSISQTRYNIRQKYGYGVYVTSLEETRGLEFDFMFVVGLVDGEFPPIYQPEIFFSQPRQNKKEKYHLTENRYLFYQCITNFKNKLFVTFPKKDGDMEFVPSSFIDSLLKIIRCNDWRTEIQSELDNFIYSEDELLTRIGKNRGVGYEQALDLRLQEDILNTVQHIYHSIEIERGRLKPDDKLEFKGYIYNKLKPAAKESLENMKQKTYSISQLEKYAGCPFKYFMDQILYLNVVKELEEGITPLEKGTILHEVLFKFYIDRRSNGLPPLVDCSEAEYQEAVAKLITLTEEKLNSLPETDLFTFLEKELILGTSASRGIVHEFLDNERNRKLEVAPSFFEVPIGKRIGDRQNTDNLLYSEEAVQVGNVKIRGKVDRIDTGNNYFTVIDYKTGSSVPNIDDIRSGLSLQLPVYLYVIETLFSKKFQKELSPAAGLYYVLTSPVKEELGVSNKELDGKAFNLNKRRKGFVDNEEELTTLIHQSIKFVNEYVEAISRGEFPITTEDKMKTVCNYCEFDRICRKQTLLK